MKITEKGKDKNKISIEIQGDLIINSTKELKDEFSKYLKNIKNIELDLSAIEKIDTAGFQFLAMLRKEIEGKDKIFTIINPSGEIKRISRLYGERI